MSDAFWSNLAHIIEAAGVILTVLVALRTGRKVDASAVQGDAARTALQATATSIETKVNGQSEALAESNTRERIAREAEMAALRRELAELKLKILNPTS
jgi:hypothetical protein